MWNPSKPKTIEKSKDSSTKLRNNGETLPMSKAPSVENKTVRRNWRINVQPFQFPWLFQLKTKTDFKTVSETLPESQANL